MSTKKQQQEITLIITGLGSSARFTNDDELEGYEVSSQVLDHKDLIINKNLLIEKGYWTQAQFEWIMNNWIETNQIFQPNDMPIN